MRYLSLFSGIEAATSAWHGLGWECAAVAEIEQFPKNLLQSRYPHVPNLGDVTRITEADIAMLGQIDLVVFGSPCQDLSVAGKRKGLDGVRSGLFFTAMQIIRWAREWGGCRFALWENVPGAFTSNKGLDFAAVVDALAGCTDTQVPPKGWGNEGAAVGEQGMVEWGTLDAQWFGVAQRRRRVFALADFGDWASRPPVLLERQGLRGDLAPRRHQGQDVAGSIAASAGKRGGVNEPDSGHLIAFGGNNTSGPIAAAAALNAAGGAGRMDFESETFVVSTLDASYARLQGASGQDANHGHSHLVVCATGDVTHTLKAEGFDASEDGTGRGTPIVSVLPFDTTQVTSAANRSNTSWGDPCRPLAAGAHPPTIAFNSNAQPDEMRFDPHVSAALTCSQTAAVAFQSSQSGVRISDVHATLDSNNGPRRHNGVLSGLQVRRLTPLECERLQAFPDDHTAILVKGKLAADGPRYKALGNSMCVHVMHYIGQRIDFVHRYY